MESDLAGAYLGIAVGGAGDVDGDGAEDLVVGASLDAGGGGPGKVALLMGSPSL